MPFVQKSPHARQFQARGRISPEEPGAAGEAGADAAALFAPGLTLLALLPAVVMSVSPFLRIIIVLHFLRQALGTQGIPSNQVMLGLSLFLSMLIMQPVAQDIYYKAWEPVSDGQISVAKGV